MKVEELVTTRYHGAKEIYTLSRTKKMSGKERAFDWLVALFTPAPGIVEEADFIADHGLYFLVVEEKQDLLVRAEKGALREIKLENRVTDKKFNYEGSQFKKVKEIHGQTV